MPYGLLHYAARLNLGVRRQNTLMATLIFSILLLGSLPALLPRWRHVIIGTGVLLAAYTAALVYALRDLESNPSGGDGPAFFGIMFVFGCAQAIIATSLVGRVVARMIARSITLSAKTRVIRLLLAFSLLPLAAAGALVAQHMAATALIYFAVVLFFPLLWLALALQLAPNNSFKPTLLRKAA